MRQKIVTLALPSLAFALSLPGGAARADTACLVEGRMMSEQIKDCTRTTLAIPAAQYAAQCKELGSTFAAMGGTGGATVVKACPARAQAACVGPFGQPATVYYYARSPRSLADTKSSCIAQTGKWVERP